MDETLNKTSEHVDPKIDDKHVLPCDFVVGHMRFRKGVKMETLRKAAERWFKIASDAYFTPDPEKVKKLDEMMKDILAGK